MQLGLGCCFDTASCQTWRWQSSPLLDQAFRWLRRRMGPSNRYQALRKASADLRCLLHVCQIALQWTSINTFWAFKPVKRKCWSRIHSGTAMAGHSLLVVQCVPMLSMLSMHKSKQYLDANCELLMLGECGGKNGQKKIGQVAIYMQRGGRRDLLSLALTETMDVNLFGWAGGFTLFGYI